MTAPHPLGRIGQLAENLRQSARRVVDDMEITAGGDAYHYNGSTAAVDGLIIALDDLEQFIAGWRS